MKLKTAWILNLVSEVSDGEKLNGWTAQKSILLENFPGLANQHLPWDTYHLRLYCTEPYEWQRPIRLQTRPGWFTNKSKPSFLWLVSAWQAAAQLRAAVYDKRRRRTPRESASLARGNTRVHRSHRLSDAARVFLLLVFGPRGAATYVPLPKLRPGVTTWWRCDTRRCLQSSTFFHPSLTASPFARTPLLAAGKLSSSSAHLQVSDQKPEDALESKRDGAGDH